MSEKTIGYVLLVIGIGIILFAGTSVWRVFTDRSEPVQLFNFEGISIDPSEFTPDLNLSPEAQQFLQQPSTSSQDVELVSKDLLNNPINIIFHLVLMGFLASLGGRIAHIGVTMLRPIIVRVKKTEQVISPKAKKDKKP